MKLRELREQDAEIIKNWRTYPDEFKDLDYALREVGWIDEFSRKAGTRIYAGEENGAIIGFTILSKDECTDNQAEFRIALNPEMLGQGAGRELAKLTLEKGFREMGLHKIYLIVRKNNHRAKRLYERLGFKKLGECKKEIHGMMAELFEMILDKEIFERRMK